jgi:hypothetical protein
VQSHPHTFAWFVLVGRFTDAVRNSWAGAGAAAGKAGGKPAGKQEAKKEAPKKEEKAGGDDDMDLFGDEEEDEVSYYI